MRKAFLFTLIASVTLGLFSCSGNQTATKQVMSQVDESVHAIIKTTEEDNAAIYHHFGAAVEQNPEKVMLFYDKAQAVKTASDELYAYVQNFKDEMVEQAEGQAMPNAHVCDLKNYSNTRVPLYYAIQEGNALILKEKINAYRELLIDLTDGYSLDLVEELRQTLTPSVSVNAEGELVSWEDATFCEIPICACVILLTKLQSDIRYCEGRTIRYLLSQIDAY